MSAPPMNLYVRLSIGPVRQEDVDALLSAMDAPLGKDESERARAEVLHRLVNEPTLGELRGQDGRRLDVTAAHALRSMGWVYGEASSERALKLLEQFPRAPVPVRPRKRSSSFPPSQSVIDTVGLVWGAAEVCFALLSLKPIGLLFAYYSTLTLLFPSYLLRLIPRKRGLRLILALLLPVSFLASLCFVVLSLLALPGRWNSTLQDAYSLLLWIMVPGLVIRFVLIQGVIPIFGGPARRK